LGSFPQVDFHNADVVFAGIPTSVRRVANPDSARDGDSGQSRGRPGVVEYHFSVTHLWKGSAAETISVATLEQSSACGYPFKLGTSYLVFAWKWHDGFSTAQCTRVGPLRYALWDLRVLGGANGLNGVASIERPS